MANDQISLDEYLNQLNSRVEAFNVSSPINFGQMGLTPIEPLTYSSGTTTTGTGIFVSPSSTGTPVWTTTASNPYTVMGAGQNIQPGGKIVIQGEDADLVIGKKSMRDWMEKVEEKLNILTPNPEMEKEWDDLRKLGERYRKLEEKCREKSDMWNRLKAMPKPEIK
jgi:hypothetical protein